MVDPFNNVTRLRAYADHKIEWRVKMSNPIVDGMEYDSINSVRLRKEIVAFRDGAILANNYHQAVVLSHLISWMTQIITEKWDVTPEEQNNFGKES